MTVQRRTLPATRAHAVVRSPFFRQFPGALRARHDGPPRGWPRDDLDKVVGNFERLRFTSSTASMAASPATRYQAPRRNAQLTSTWSRPHCILGTAENKWGPPLKT